MMDLQIDRAAPAGAYAALAAALYLWHAAAAFFGVFLADRLGIGDAGFEFARDLKRAALCSLLALAPFFALFYFAQTPVLFMIYIFCFLLALKFAYLSEGNGFRLWILGAALAGMIVFVPVVRLLPLPGFFFLYLAGLASLLAGRHFRRRSARAARESDDRKENRIRLQAKADANFATPCYRCRFWRQEVARCLLRLAGDEVREIVIDSRRYCVSFDPQGERI